MGSPASVTYVRVSYEASSRADMGYLEVWTDLYRSRLQHRSLSLVVLDIVVAVHDLRVI